MSSSIDISSRILSKRWFSKKREYNSKRFPTNFLLRSITKLYKVPKIWWMWFGKLGTYIKGIRVVGLVHSRNSKYLRIRIISFDQVNL